MNRERCIAKAGAIQQARLCVILSRHVSYPFISAQSYKRYQPFETLVNL